MWELDLQKAESWRIDAFELWCWKGLLRVPWMARRSNHSILKEISPEYSLGGLMLKLKLQYFGHLMWRTDSLEKTLMLGKIEGRRRRGQQRMIWFDVNTTWWTCIWASCRSWWWTGRPDVLQSMGSQCSDMTEWLNRTDIIKLHLIPNLLYQRTSCFNTTLSIHRNATPWCSLWETWMYYRRKGQDLFATQKKKVRLYFGNVWADSWMEFWH